MTLDLVPIGAQGRITAVHGSGPFRRRLLELGLLPGTDIVRTGQAPLGDPLTFRIRGATVCLRREDAKAIAVAVLAPTA